MIVHVKKSLLGKQREMLYFKMGRCLLCQWSFSEALAHVHPHCVTPLKCDREREREKKKKKREENRPGSRHCPSPSVVQSELHREIVRNQKKHQNLDQIGHANGILPIFCQTFATLQNIKNQNLQVSFFFFLKQNRISSPKPGSDQMQPVPPTLPKAFWPSVSYLPMTWPSSPPKKPSNLKCVISWWCDHDGLCGKTPKATDSLPMSLQCLASQRPGLQVPECHMASSTSCHHGGVAICKSLD